MERRCGRERTPGDYLYRILYKKQWSRKRCDARYRYPMVIRGIDGTSRHFRRPSGSGSCVQSLPGLRFRLAI